MDELSQARLRDLLHYDPDTGFFTWCVSVKGSKGKHKQAGTLHRAGYRYIFAFGHKLAEHRLAWLYLYGVLPPHEIDHINGKRDDNRASNIRLSTRGENAQNRHKHRIGVSGKLGVVWHKAANKWAANIKINKKVKHLGVFSDVNDAARARQQAEAIYFPFKVQA
jgi:hypothetical protein